MNEQRRASQTGAITLAALGLLHGAYAILGDKPWTKEIAKRIAAGKALQLPHYITIGLWYASVAGAILCLASAAALWWSSRRNKISAETPATAKLPRAFIWGMVGIFALALATRLPRLGQSFWNDELKAMEMFVVGETLQKDARHDYSDTWQRAVYGNPEANNHQLCTIETRLMHRLWKTLSPKADGAPFSERWLRFPALCWGLLGIGLAGWLGQRLGGTRVGLCAALLLSMHPWHIRFSTETRGYAAAMACILVVLICLHRLISERSQRWQWWALWAGAEWLGMLAYSASAPVLAGINIVAIVVLLRRRDWHSLAWLIAANALAATLFLDLAAPGIPQISAFLKDRAAGHLPPISFAWWQDVASAFTTGDDWHRGYSRMAELPLWQRTGLLAGCYGLAFLGTWNVFKRGTPAMKLVTSAWLLAVALVLLQNILGKQAMLTWYLCPLLPGMALCIAWGWTSKSRLATALAAIWLLCLVPVLLPTVTHPRQPVRDMAQLIQQRWPNAVVAYFGLTETHVDPYLRTIHVLARGPGSADDVTQMKAWEQQAAAAHRPFIVWYGGHQEQRSPDMMQYFQSQGFKQEAMLTGADEMYDMFVRVKHTALP